MNSRRREALRIVATSGYLNNRNLKHLSTVSKATRQNVLTNHLNPSFFKRVKSSRDMEHRLKQALKLYADTNELLNVNGLGLRRESFAGVEEIWTDNKKSNDMIADDYKSKIKVKDAHVSVSSNHKIYIDKNDVSNGITVNATRTLKISIPFQNSMYLD
jgi:hypothetical protein